MSERPADPIPAPVVLEYGARRLRLRWRGWMTWAVLGVAAITAIAIGWPKLNLYLERRAGWAKVVAWHQAAQKYVVPAGTLLCVGSSPSPFTSYSPPSTSFSSRFPLLRNVAVDSKGVPLLVDNGVLYVHAHPYWNATGGTQQCVIVISDFRRQLQGQWQFESMAYGTTANGMDHWFRTGARAIVQAGVARSLAHMRIFAGAPNPADPTRFALPFACDGGTGRFEFQTDTDVSDGGKLAPDVQMVWDTPTNTPGSTQPTAVR